MPYKKALKDTLSACPHIQTVYFDSKGHWHFTKKKARDAASREDILSAPDEQPEPKPTKKTK